MRSMFSATATAQVCRAKKTTREARSGLRNQHGFLEMVQKATGNQHSNRCWRIHNVAHTGHTGCKVFRFHFEREEIDQCPFFACMHVLPQHRVSLSRSSAWLCNILKQKTQRVTLSFYTKRRKNVSFFLFFLTGETLTATSQEQVSSSLNSAAKSKNHVFVFLSLFFCLFTLLEVCAAPSSLLQCVSHPEGRRKPGCRRSPRPPLLPPSLSSPRQSRSASRSPPSRCDLPNKETTFGEAKCAPQRRHNAAIYAQHLPTT